MPNCSAELNWHCRESYELLKRDPSAFAASFARAARTYALPPGVDPETRTVVDPIPYRGGPLKYTPSREKSRGLQAILRYSEGLAFQYAALASSLDSNGRLSVKKQADQIAQLHSLLAERFNLLSLKNVELDEAHRRLQAALQQSLEHRRELESAIRRSWTWKAGRMLVGPFSLLKKLGSRVAGSTWPQFQKRAA